MPKRAAKAARKNAPLALLLQFLYGAALGLCGMHCLVDAVEASASFGQYLFCVAWMLCVLAASAFLQILLHEGGHLVCGLCTGYRFVSFRIGSWMVQRENGRLKVHRYTLSGTAGQCLLAPPEMQDGKMPYKIYNLGGVLFNLLAALVSILLAGLCRDVCAAKAFFELLAITGIGFAVTNGIPLRAQGVANDGANARDLGKDPAALRAFWVQLSVNAQQAEGVPLREMPAEWFTLPTEGLDNIMVAAQAVLHANRLMDEQRFEETARAIDALDAQNSALLPLHRNLLLCDRLTCALFTGEDTAALLQRWNSREMKTFRKQMGTFLAVLRTEYLAALLVEHDAAKAEVFHQKFEQRAKTYPYTAETASERALLERGRQKAEA